MTAGVITPLYTPAKEGGRLDTRGLANYVDWLAKDPNVDGLFVRCGVGKMFTFTAEEIKESIDVTMEAVAGRKFVQFSTFGVFDGKHYNRPDQDTYIAETVKFSQYAQEKGATGVVLVMPWMLLPKKGESIEDLICRYVGTVASSIEIPIVLYNPPTVPRDYSLSSDLLRRLTEIPNVIGAKISSTSMSWFSRLEEAAEGTSFSIISGTEWAYYQALMTGSLGVIGGGCNVYPSILKALYEAFMEGDYNVARKTQWDVNNANEFFRGYSSTNGGLSYLRAKGLDIEPWDKTGEPLESKEEALRKYADLEPILAKYKERA
jgi:4-hydroxy-tetrahydrodipicolinate synthase